MKRFLIQTQNGLIMHDFGFRLHEAVRYQNWIYDLSKFEFVLPVLSDTVIEGDFIPVGSLEFVFEFMEKNHGVTKDKVIPINIPEQLWKQEFLKRQVSFMLKNEVKIDKPMFIKSNSAYKSFADIVSEEGTWENAPEDAYLVSEVVDIESEWRMFVFNDELVGAKHYLGDFTLMPDFHLVEAMIKQYKGNPGAYTLDIGINETGTFLIEVHPFVSCGLYGFNDYRILPQMFIRGYQYMLNEAKKKK